MSADPTASGPHSPGDDDRTQQELALYRAELEVQNEQLISAQSVAEAVAARYASLFQLLPMPALVVARNGLIEESNEGAATYFGFRDVAHLRRHSVFRLLRVREDTRLAEALRTASPPQPQTLRDVGVRCALADDAVCDVHLVLLPQTYQLDEHCVLLFADQTAQRASERERLVFQAVLDNANALIYAFDRDGRCILANHALLETVHQPLDKVLGQRREAWLPEADAKAHAHNDHAVLVSEKALTYEETLLGPDGRKRHYISQKFPLLNPGGQVFAVAGITTDVTQSRETELRLQLAMRVFQQGSEGIVITDHDNRILSVNRAFEAITGYTEAEVLGKSPSLLKSGKQPAEFYARMWAELLTKGRWEGELWNRRKDGVVYPQRLSISRVAGDTEESINYVAVFTDVSQRKLAEEEIERLAFYDILTGVPNRYLLRDRVEQAIRAANRAGQRFALIFMDVDHFKEINDLHGHDVGDMVLVEVAQRLKAALREQDTISRQGGDEFVLLLPDLDQPGVQQCVAKVLAALAPPMPVGDVKLRFTISLGVALFPDDGRSFVDLIKNADTAMYQAKKAGRNQVAFFSPAMAAHAERRGAIEAELRAALDNQELAVVYQPKVDLASGRLAGVEALLRWHSPRLGRVSPDEFIPIAEETGLIVAIGNWVLAQSLAQVVAWEQQGLGTIAVSVNVSAAQFWTQDFPQLVADTLRETGVAPACLELELTERLALRSPDQGVAIMHRLKAVGVALSMDDFGTGYSSLSYLSRLPVDVLKVDQSFVRDLGRDPADEIIVRAIVQLARTLGLHTVAEGVETEGQLGFLTECGCHAGQGYLFARPMAPEALAPWLAEHPVWT
jgi:two-component system CheB/CheR fusion protein